MKKTLLLFALFMMTSTMLVFGQKDETIFGNSGLHLTGLWGGYMQNISTFQDDFFMSRNSFFVFEINKKVLIGWAKCASQY